jgi:hypothetical protein
LQLATILSDPGIGTTYILSRKHWYVNRVTDFPYPLQQRVQVLRVDFHNSQWMDAGGQPNLLARKPFPIYSLTKPIRTWPGRCVAVGVAL